mmetsp:Transcript_66317/g.151687  ORF Transcript_66317/g.151687 Transcript_66317/m.151687 type:complete len:84 (-) Transcript_66317:183-434(-)
MRVVLIVVSTCAAYFLRSGAGLEVDGSNSTAMTSAVGASVNSSGMVGANSTANHTFRPAGRTRRVVGLLEIVLATFGNQSATS